MSMTWLASFPRSGNTFFRNILYEVYGLESSTFHTELDIPLTKNYSDYPFVKTHLLPDQLIPKDSTIPAIYLVRDGRDALCSEAHATKDFVHPHSHFLENLKAAIIAEKGSFLGVGQEMCWNGLSARKSSSGLKISSDTPWNALNG